MNEIWNLPQKAELCGRKYEIHGDFRDILEIFSYFENPDLPPFVKWRIAAAIFFEPDVPEEAMGAAAEYLGWFIRCGQPEVPGNPPKMLDWDQDGEAIISDINRVAGREIRSMPFVHWWTFMAWFHGIGQGQLSAILTIREKLKKGKKLEGWEKDFYRENPDRIHIRQRYSQQELMEREKWNRILAGNEAAGKEEGKWKMNSIKLNL